MLPSLLLVMAALAGTPADVGWRLNHAGMVPASCAPWATDAEVWHGPELGPTCSDEAYVGDGFTLQVEPIATLGPYRFLSVYHSEIRSGAVPRQGQRWVAYDASSDLTVEPTEWLDEDSLISAIRSHPWMKVQLSDEARTADTFVDMKALSPELGWQTIAPYDWVPRRGKVSVRLALLPAVDTCDICPNTVREISLSVTARPGVRQDGIPMRAVEDADRSAALRVLRWSVNGTATTQGMLESWGRDEQRQASAGARWSDFRRRFPDPVVHSTRVAPDGSFKVIEVFDRSQTGEHPIRTSLWFWDGVTTPMPFTQEALWRRIRARGELSSSEHAAGWAHLMALTTAYVRSTWIWRPEASNARVPAEVSSMLEKPTVAHDGSGWNVRFVTVELQRSFRGSREPVLTLTRWRFHLDGKASTWSAEPIWSSDLRR